MVNSKAIGGIVIGIIIVIVAAYALNQDQSSISNETPSEIVQDSSVAISDSAALDQNNQDFEINEDGTKRYTISVGDNPSLED